jgi:hypothetical protein
MKTRDRSRLLSLLIVLAATTVFPACVWANGDGLYCWTPEYFAYQLTTADPDGHMTLYVLDLVAPFEKGPRAEVRLALFTARGLRCERDRIQLLSWERLYVIDVAKRRRPLLAKVTPLPSPGSKPAGFSERGNGSDLSFGAYLHQLLWDGPGYRTIIVPLTVAAPHHFELRTSAFDAHQECRVGVRSQIAQVGNDGCVLRAVTVYERLEHTECGE